MMVMTNEEILRSYRQAMDPKQQIEILADLNLCDRTKIVEVLLDGGVDPNELPALPRYQRGSVYAPPKTQATSGGGRRWVWNPNRNKTAAEVIAKAKERYDALKKEHGDGDPFVQGFKACIDYMEGK